MNEKLLLPSALLVLCACTHEPDLIIERPVPAASSSSVSSAVASSVVQEAAVSSVSSAASSLPRSLRIAVPFMIQSPFGVWDELHEETCEEASLIMVERYLEGASSITSQEAENELQSIVPWMTERGYNVDVTVAELLEVAKERYGLDGRVEEDVTEERIKELLSKGYPIILPVAGRRIGNPYFSGEGPFFHMLVIVGFDGSDAITHDPGTKRGENYRYPFSRLLAATHDWTGVKEEIEKGVPRMLILWKN